MLEPSSAVEGSWEIIAAGTNPDLAMVRVERLVKGDCKELDANGEPRLLLYLYGQYCAAFILSNLRRGELRPWAIGLRNQPEAAEVLREFGWNELAAVFTVGDE